MRLFLGIDLPPDIKRDIQNYLQPIKQSPKGWVDPHDYHQTLLFIGESDDEEVEVLKERLETFSFYPFKVKLSHFQFFNRRVMFLGIDESPDLKKLKDKIENDFPEWVHRSGKPFIPHITVKRWQRYEYDHLKRGLAVREMDSMEFIVNSLCLFKSEKDSLNRKYHVIAEKMFN